MQLPITVQFHHDETPLSLASRLAIANDYRSLAELLSFTDVTENEISSCKDHALERLSDWSGIPANEIARYRTLKGRTGIWHLGSASFTKGMRPSTKHRFCPHCILNDIANNNGRPETRPYARASWSIPLVRTCVTHLCDICEVDNSGTKASDLSRFVADNLSIIQEMTDSSDNAENIDLARYIWARIDGISVNGFLDNFTSAVALELCTRLGHLVRRHGAITDLAIAAQDDTTIGFSFASKGPNAIEDIVQRSLTTAKLEERKVGAFFGSIRHWLRANSHDPDFVDIARVFQCIAERTFPLGHEDVFIFPTTKRALHSITSASKQWGVTEGHVRTVLENAGVIGQNDLPPPLVTFSAAAANAIFGSQQTGMTVRDIYKEWRLPMHKIRDLVASGLLAKVDGSGGRSGSRIVVNREVFEDLVKKIDGPSVRPSELTDLVPLLKAPSRLHALDKILRAVHSGDLKVVRHGGKYLTNLWLNKKDLAHI